MRVILTESQLKRLLTEKNKLILVEQNPMDLVVGFSAWLDHNVGKHLTDFGDYIWYGSKTDDTDGLENGKIGDAKIPYFGYTEADKNKISRETKKAIEEIPEIPESFGKLYKMYTGDELDEVLEGFKQGLLKSLKEKSPEEHIGDVLNGIHHFYQFGKKEILKPLKYALESGIESVEKGIEDFGEWVEDCFNDLDCLIDVASVAVIALPGVGLALSAAIDIGHGAWYVVRYNNASTREEKQALLIGATFSFLGGIAGKGIKQSVNIVKEVGTNKDIYKYCSDLIDLGNKSSNNKILKSNIEKLNNKYKLTTKELKTVDKILNSLKTLDKNIINNYTEAIKVIGEDLNVVQRANLKQLMQNNNVFQTILKNSDNNIPEALSKYLNKVARREAVMELSLFYALDKSLRNEKVGLFISKGIRELRDILIPDIRNTVELEGYDWFTTKQAFGAISEDDPDYSFEKSKEDNLNLKKAWEEGWRPFNKSIKNPTQMDFNEVPEKYQTKKYKDLFKNKEKVNSFNPSDDLLKNKDVNVEDDFFVNRLNKDTNDTNVSNKYKEQELVDSLMNSIDPIPNADYENFDLDN
tara:strand:+ start:1343 stop:3085 length:1743 start_codon:yes stop_codon:yes gene_type:complete